jgi:hypothetical protein
MATARPRGGRPLKFVAVIERESRTHESWTDRGDVTDALAALEGWNSQVRRILIAVAKTFVWAHHDAFKVHRAERAAADS